MKTITKIIILVAVVSILLLIGSKAFALGTYKQAELNDFTVLENPSTDLDAVKISKFKDASTTCYMLTTKPTQYIPSNLAISCVK